jgi:hypothetical protein
LLTGIRRLPPLLINANVIACASLKARTRKRSQPYYDFAERFGFNGSPLTINGGVAGGWLNKDFKDCIEPRALQTLLPPNRQGRNPHNDCFQPIADIEVAEKRTL